MTGTKSIRNFCPIPVVRKPRLFPWNEMHSCAQIRRMSSLRYIYICKTRGKLHEHVRAREKNFKQNCNLEMLFLFFFFPWISRYQNAMIKCQNVSFTKPRRFLILHVTRALISFEPFFFFFFWKKRKKDLILSIRLMKREMRIVKILRLEESNLL